MSKITNPSGIMRPKKELTALRQQIRNVLGPTKALTLDQKLSQLTEVELKNLLQTARLVQFGMSLPNNHSKSYADVVLAMYPKLHVNQRDLIAEMLQDSVPVERIGITPKSEPADYKADVYNEWLNVLDTPDDKSASALQFALAETLAKQTKQPSSPTGNDAFLAKLTQSESSGNSQAEITIKDGRRFVGSLQFGSARLADFKKHSGKRFTQDEFKADTALQAEVADWHIADIDKAIDGLGDAAKGYDRDGLRSVAHLGGKGGMRGFVESGGKHNPADELGTSLKDYYDKFSS